MRLDPSEFVLLLPPKEAEEKKRSDDHDYDVESFGEFEDEDEDEELVEESAPGTSSQGSTESSDVEDGSEPLGESVPSDGAPQPSDEGEEVTPEEEGMTLERDSENEELEDTTLFDGFLTDIPDPKELLDAGLVLAEELARGDGTPTNVLTTDFDRRPYVPHPEARSRDSVRTWDADNEDRQDIVAEIRVTTAMTSRTIATQLRRVLYARAANRKQRDRVVGRLDRRKLYTLNRPGQTRPNRRVFQTTIQGQSTRIAVTILIDQSGSMNQKGKIGCARQTTVALGDALHSLSTLGVKFQVYGFDLNARLPSQWYPGIDRVEPLRLYVYKEAHENWNRVWGRVGFMEGYLKNCDGECVRWAAKRLLEVDADRRILMVLSDGTPNGHAMSARMSHDVRRVGQLRIAMDLRRAVTDVTEVGVDVLGIGIMTRSVREYYPNHIVIDSASDLESTVMNAVRDLILGTPTAKTVT